MYVPQSCIWQSLNLLNKNKYTNPTFGKVEALISQVADDV